MFSPVHQHPSRVNCGRPGSNNTLPHAPARAFAGRKNWRNAFLGTVLIMLLGFMSSTPGYAQQTIVEKYGQLRVQGNRIVDKNGEAIQLRGMSLYWSQWIPKFYNYDAVKWLRDDWKITVVRAAMAVDNGGYATNPAAATAEKNKVIAVVDAAISLGIYVIIDFHVHEAQNYKPQALAFFSEMAQRYKDVPNVLYEPWNEPINPSWATVIKPYHEEVIAAIRQHDPDNIIICGTRFYAQEINEAALNPINQPNIAYTLHYYANSHKQFLRDRAQQALNNGIAIFVTEYGTTDASGNGVVNETESKTWWAFLDRNKISHANWSVADIGESSASLARSGNGVNVSATGGWPLSQIKQSGQLVRNELRLKNPLATTDFAITGASSLTCQTVSPTERRLTFMPQYAGATSDPITFSVVSAMMPTTAPGPYTLRIFTDAPIITLEARQGNETSSWAYDWLAVCGNTTPASTSLAITGATLSSCETIAPNERQLTFTPQYAGVTSGTAAPPLTFSVVSAMMPTTAPGPYTLRINTDAPVITLKAQQGNRLASYTYNWLAVCTSNGARKSAESTGRLTVTVLGNPAGSEAVDVEVRGAMDQSLQLQLLDAGGHSLNTTTVESAGDVQRVRVGLGRAPGIYLLRVNTPTQKEVVKVLRP